MNRKTPYIGLASGAGGRKMGAEEGPLLLQKNLQDCRWEAMVHVPVSLEKVSHVSAVNTLYAQESFKVAKKDPFLISIGGDHSCAIGTWSGIVEARRLQKEETALLWFDAHMDSHTLSTSESGNPHGMPLAALLGEGSPFFTHILSPSPKILPQNLFLIGIRSYEPPEKALLERMNVRVYYIDEVKKRGLREVVEEILSHLALRKIRYGISMDIDFFDPVHMMATGTPEEGGPSPEEFLAISYLLDPVAFEFVEFNPSLDQEGKSLSYIKQILQSVDRTPSS
jgi:arginase